MSEEQQQRVDEISEEIRELRSIYRIAVSDDGKKLADRLHIMLEKRIGRMIGTDDKNATMILKGECRGISAVIEIFAHIEDELEVAEAEMNIERTDEQF